MQKNEGKEKSKSFDLDDGASVHTARLNGEDKELFQSYVSAYIEFQQQVILTALFQISGSEQD